MGSYLAMYGLAAVAFTALDAVWLGIVAKDIYKKHIGDIMLAQPNWGAAGAFYLLFLIGLVYFAIAPAIAEGSISRALLNGALYGFFTYATYDFTNWATLKGFPGVLVPIDLAWGTFISAATAGVAYWLYSTISA